MRNKVMLIDDHPAMLMALKSMLLNQVPFKVVAQAQSGEEYLSVLKNVQPDIVILDLDMPKTDGFDVIRKIGISYPNIRILILSSLDEQVYGGRVRSLGAHGFVNKTASANIIWQLALQFHKAIPSSQLDVMAMQPYPIAKRWHRFLTENYKS